ncbi:MAG: adenylyl-sulfate kinase, partial [Pseudomonadota bacterium]
SPYRADRDDARAAAGDSFLEVLVDADLSVCERRDPKGLYAKARAGEIKDFTGVDSIYEAPASPDLRIATADESVADSAERLAEFAREKFAL